MRSGIKNSALLLGALLATQSIILTGDPAQAGIRDMVKRIFESGEQRQQRVARASRVALDELESRSSSVFSDLASQIVRPKAGRILQTVGLEEPINKFVRALKGRDEIIFIEGPIGSGKTQLISGFLERRKLDAAKGIHDELSNARFIGVNLNMMSNASPFSTSDLFQETLQTLSKNDNPLVLVIRDLGPLFAQQEQAGPVMAYVGQLASKARSQGFEVKIVIEGTNGEIQSIVKNNAKLKNIWETSGIKMVAPEKEQVQNILVAGAKIISKNNLEGGFTASFSEEALDFARVWGSGYYRKYSQPYASIKLLEDATAIRKQAFLDAKAGREISLITSKREALGKINAKLERAKELANAGRRNAINEKNRLAAEGEELEQEIALLVKNYGSAGSCCELTQADIAIAVSQMQTETSLTRLLRLAKGPKAWDAKTIEKRFNELVSGQPSVAKAAAKAIADLIDPRTAKSAKMIIISGPPGTGKSHSKWAIKQILDEMDLEPGSLDLGSSELATAHGAIARMQGAPVGYEGWGKTETLADAIKPEGPTIILLDEVEKGEGVQGTLLTAIQEGKFTDNNGKTVSLQQTLFVVTTNTLDEVSPEMASNPALLKNEIHSRSLQKAAADKDLHEVTTPFLSRADHIVYAGHLKPADLEVIMEREVKILMRGDEALGRNADETLSSRMIGLELSPEAKRLISWKTYVEDGGKPNGRRISKEFPVMLKDHIDSLFKTGFAKVQQVSTDPKKIFSGRPKVRAVKVEDGQLLRLEARITKGTPEDPEDFELFLAVVKD